MSCLDREPLATKLRAATERIKLLEAVTNDPHALWANWLRGSVALPAGIGDVRQYQDRIKRLEAAGDRMASILKSTRQHWYSTDQCEVVAFDWNEAKEAKL
jgi:hypothetical protein